MSQFSYVITFDWLDKKKYERLHDKTNKMTCVPSEDLDQPGHPLSLIRVFAVRMKKLPIECTVKTDQTGQMPRLICVFAGRTCPLIGFVMLWLILNIVRCWGRASFLSIPNRKTLVILVAQRIYQSRITLFGKSHIFSNFPALKIDLALTNETFSHFKQNVCQHYLLITSSYKFYGW